MGLGFMIHVSNIGCENIPGTTIPTSFMFSFPPMPFIHGYSHLLCHWVTALSLARAAKRLFPSAGSPLPSCHTLWHNPRVFCLGSTTDRWSDPFPYITSIDRRADCRIWRVETMCGKRCFILLIGSHGRQRHGWNVNISKPYFFQQTRSQNHGSWISRVLWRWEPEMINPVKSHAEVENNI